MTPILIIADDLSGAADCASAFFKAGLETLVIIEPEAGEDVLTAGVEVVAIDADTRRLPGAEAAQVQFDLFKRCYSAGQLFYKKIDSTLRGNFAQELAAIINQAGLAIVAPAFPQLGRYTRNGHQYLHDTPLEATEIWRAAGIPGAAHIPGMLARHGIAAASIGVNELRKGEARLRGLLEARAREGVQAVVCDAEADADLQTIARASIALSLPRFWVGSAGLALHLSGALRASAKPAQPPGVKFEGSILALVGSLSSVSRAQAEHLFGAGAMQRLDVPASVLRRGRTHPQWQDLRNALGMSLRKMCDLLVVIGTDDEPNEAEGLQLCRELAALVAPHTEHIGAIIATGGETARAILTAMGARGLRLAGEIEPGVPLSIASGIKPVPVITKAGAFGSRETLSRCYASLRQTRAVSACTANAGGSGAGHTTVPAKAS